SEQLFISVRLGPVEVIPGVSESALLWLAQSIKDDALETLHREGVFQESPKVCFVQSRNKCPDRFFLKMKLVSLCGGRESLRGGIAQNGKEGVEHPHGFGPVQNHADCHDRIRILTEEPQAEFVLGVPERRENGVRVRREESVRVCGPLGGVETSIHHRKRSSEAVQLERH